MTTSTDSTPAAPPAPIPGIATARGDIIAGLVSSTVAIPLAMAFGMFAFVTLGDEYFAYGAMAGLLLIAINVVLAVFIGIVLAVLLFVVRMSRSNIRRFYRCDTVRSRRYPRSGRAGSSVRRCKAVLLARSPEGSTQRSTAASTRSRPPVRQWLAAH